MSGANHPVASAAPELSAVLWDLDGTLADSEPYWIDCEFALVARYGGTWSLEHAHQLIGNALEVSAAYLQKHGGIPLSVPEIIEELVAGVTERIRAEVPWRPGVLDVLADLRQAGIQCALVTMSYAPIADAIVASLPEGTFSAVVTGDSVSNGKPHPEPYLTAASALGVAPGTAVAVEDSATGGASARAAGIPVLAVPTVHSLELAPAQFIRSDLSGLTVAELRQIHANLYRELHESR